MLLSVFLFMWASICSRLKVIQNLLHPHVYRVEHELFVCVREREREGERERKAERERKNKVTKVFLIITYCE